MITLLVGAQLGLKHHLIQGSFCFYSIMILLGEQRQQFPGSSVASIPDQETEAVEWKGTAHTDPGSRT